MDGSILAQSHYADLSHKTETLVKPHYKTEWWMFIPICQFFMLFTVTSLKTTQFAGSATRHISQCFFFFFSYNGLVAINPPPLHTTRGNWQLFVHLQKEWVEKLIR